MLGHAVDDVKCIVWINKCVGRKDVPAVARWEPLGGNARWWITERERSQ